MKIAFVGDIMPGGVLTHKGGVDKEIIDYLSTFDLRVGTLETAFGDGTKFCHIKTEVTPDLCTVIYSPDESVKLLKEMNIDIVTLANNHSCDCDLEGLRHTIEVLDKAGIKHFGAGNSIFEASTPIIIEKEEKTFCFIGYLQEYHYLYRGPGYIPNEITGGINLFKIEKVIEEIKKYKKIYDYVFVLPHWGCEGSLKPRIAENRYAKKMVKAGADGVIGSHAHVVQPIFKFKKSIIAMNLGNFLFPDRYVIPPRITYYPNKSELNKNIPTIGAFKKVSELTLIIVSKKERTGIILGIDTSTRKTAFFQKYVRLDKNNNLHFCSISGKHKLKLYILSFLCKHSFLFIEKIFSKFEKKKEKFNTTYYPEKK